MHHGVANGLRQVRLDVVTTTDAGLLGTPDTVQLAHAHATGRVLVTQDRDFIRLHREGRQLSGIAYFEQGTRSIRQVIDALKLLNDVYDPEEMLGRLEYI